MRILVKAVRVLPDPVGDETSTLFLSWMTGMAIDCGSVRAVNLSLNHLETRGSIMPRTSSIEYFLSIFSNISPPNKD